MPSECAADAVINCFTIYDEIYNSIVKERDLKVRADNMLRTSVSFVV